jgi:CrcB protein
MRDWLCVAAGGAAGSLVRHWIGGLVPWGTLAVNVTGSLLVGVCFGLGIGDARWQTLRLLLVTGFAGGFTTYSAFNQEVVDLMRAGAWPRAAGYAALTFVAALAGGAAGIAAARALRS